MLLTGIGELVTNDPAPDREGGPLGIVRDAAVLVEDGRIAWVGPPRTRPSTSRAATNARTAARPRSTARSGTPTSRSSTSAAAR